MLLYVFLGYIAMAVIVTTGDMLQPRYMGGREKTESLAGGIFWPVIGAMRLCIVIAKIVLGPNND